MGALGLDPFSPSVEPLGDVLEADTLNPVDGADVITGGAGDDTLVGDTIEDPGNGVPPPPVFPANDLLEEGDGSDILIATGGLDTLVGGAGADFFVFLYDRSVIRDFEDGVDSWGINPE